MVLQPIPIYRYPQNPTKSSDEVNLMSCIHDVSVPVLSLFSMAIGAKDQEEPQAPLPLCLSALRNHRTRFACKCRAFSSVRMKAQGASNRNGCGRPCIVITCRSVHHIGVFNQEHGTYCTAPKTLLVVHTLRYTALTSRHRSRALSACSALAVASKSNGVTAVHRLFRPL